MKKVLLSILLLLPMTLSAQAFYDYTPNARVAAMGGAAIATCADAFAVFGNAASTLMEYKAVQASFSYADFAGEYRKHRMLSGGAYARFAQRHALVVGAQINIEPKNSSGYRPASQLFDLAYLFCL